MLPFITILIPIRNEVEYIQRCLEAVLAQEYHQDQIEILIADGMSTDGTRHIIQTFQADHPHIQPKTSISEGALNRIRTALSEKGAAGLQINFEIVDEIPLPPTGKHRFVINKLSESETSRD